MDFISKINDDVELDAEVRISTFEAGAEHYSLRTITMNPLLESVLCIPASSAPVGNANPCYFSNPGLTASKPGFDAYVSMVGGRYSRRRSSRSTRCPQDYASTNALAHNILLAHSRTLDFACAKTTDKFGKLRHATNRRREL